MLQMQKVAKSFGATKALHWVDLTVAAGSVLALIGENGAGKSTLMKVLAGVHRPDGGTMTLADRPYQPADPQEARRQGVMMIHQELTLAPDLSVAENIVLGAEPRVAGCLRGAEMRRLAAAALGRLERDDIPLRRLVRELPLAQQQMVEIARALIGRPRVLVFDEPTSSLTQSDTLHLFRVIDKLREDGVAIIYISHFLEECRRVADRYLVLRDGLSVAEGSMQAVADATLITAMVGREVTELYPLRQRSIGEPVLQVDRLVGRRLPRAASFELRSGEVFGIFGLVGSGRTELLRVLFGLDSRRAGRIRWQERELGSDIGERWQSGIGMLSEDRKSEGLLLARDLAENVTLSDLGRFSRWGLLSASGQRQATAGWIDRLGIRCRGPRQPVADCSGGNQQKVAVARLLQHGCRLLLLDEPTRGIDVAAKARIYQLIQEQAAEGVAIVMVSSYLPELLGVCDTIAVMCRGELAPSRPVAEWNETTLLAAAIGADEGDDDVA